MLRTHALAVLVTAACSSAAKPPVESKLPPPPPPTADAAPAALSVEDACAKVVARFEAEAQKPDSSAKPEQVAALATVFGKHCRQWPAPIVNCLATASDDAQGRCLDDLDPNASAAFYDEVIAAMKVAPECDELLDDVGVWVGYTGAVTEDSDRAMLQRAYFVPLAASCAAWSEDTRTCMGGQAGAPRACLDAQADVARALDAELALRTALFTAAGKRKPTDKKIACAAVAAAHYGDKQWKDKLVGTPAAERKKLIKASATAMAAACKDEKWTTLQRACVVSAASERERGFCIDTGARWAYPAEIAQPNTAGTGAPTGIPTCDAYLASMDELVRCDKYPAASRDAMRDAAQQVRQAWAAPMTDDAKHAASEACVNARQALIEAARALDCTMTP